MATTSHSDRIIARALSGTLWFSLRPKRRQDDARSHLDDSSNQEPSPLIGDFFNSIGQTEKNHEVTRRSVNRRKGDILGARRFVALWVKSGPDGVCKLESALVLLTDMPMDKAKVALVP